MQGKLSFIKKPYFLVLSLVSIFLIIGCFSYAAFTTSIEKKGVLNIVTGNLYPSLTSDNFNSSKRVRVVAGETKKFYVTIENTNSINVKANLYYKGLETLPSGVNVGYFQNTGDDAPGSEGYVIEKYGSSQNKKEVLIYIENTTNQDFVIEFGSSVGLSNASLTIPNGYHAITQKKQPTDESCFDIVNGEILGYSNSCSKDVVIPNIINGVTVSSIEIGAFQNRQLTSVTIPNSVTSIEMGAFGGNQLTEVIISNTVTSIDSGAFAGGNQFTTVEIPSKVSTIRQAALPKGATSNPNLGFIINRTGKSFDWGIITDSGSSQSFVTGTVSHPNGDIRVIDGTPTDESCFEFNSSTGTITKFICAPKVSQGSTQNSVPNTNPVNDITDVVIPETIGDVAVTSIGNDAFYMNTITSVLIPNGVTNIGSNAFSYNQLTSIALPNSVKSIGHSAFGYNQLNSVIIPDGVVSIGSSGFVRNQITSVSISSSVKSIDNYAFFMNQLTSVVIKGKANSSEFDSYGESIWSWASGYSDANITWNG